MLYLDLIISGMMGNSLNRKTELYHIVQPWVYYVASVLCALKVPSMYDPTQLSVI